MAQQTGNLMMVVGLSAQAHGEVVLDKDDNLAVFTGTWNQSTNGVGFYGTDSRLPKGAEPWIRPHLGHRSLLPRRATGASKSGGRMGPTARRLLNIRCSMGPRFVIRSPLINRLTAARGAILAASSSPQEMLTKYG